MDVKLHLSQDEISCAVAAVDRWADGYDVLSAVLDGHKGASGCVELTRAQAAWLHHALAEYHAAAMGRRPSRRNGVVEDAVASVVAKLQALI